VDLSPLRPTFLHLDPIITHISPHVKSLRASSYNIYNLECIGIFRLFSPPPLHFSEKIRQDSVFIHHPQKYPPEIMQKNQGKTAKKPSHPPHAPKVGNFGQKVPSYNFKRAVKTEKAPLPSPFGGISPRGWGKSVRNRIFRCPCPCGRGRRGTSRLCRRRG
jgi:hypothetical protein